MKKKKLAVGAGAILILVMMLLAHTAVALTYPIRCQSLSGVDDETGANLIDGDLIQIICTGADGIIDLPDSSGNPTSDDWLVDTTYAGCNYKLSEPNSGKFDTNVDTTYLSEGEIIYCRAWNDAAITDATRYGNSKTYTIPWSADEHDFGTWMTDTFFQEPQVNEPPVADPNGPYTGTEGVSMTFDGSGSYDTDGNIVSYDWDFGDGNTAAGVSPAHTYAQDGTYTVTLTVTDDDAATDTKATTATVADTEPNAGFSATPTSGLEPLTVTFTDASSSYDGITSREWNFGDGETSTELNPTHVYAEAGTYTVSLTVHESDGDSDIATKVDYIMVTAPAMHIASIDMTTTKYKAKGWHTYATAAVTVVDADGKAVEGAVVEGHWSGLTSDTDSGATGADGKIALDSDSVKNAKGTFTFSVDNVVLSGWTYDSASNVETGDSITV